jgi:hypothetical protein
MSWWTFVGGGGNRADFSRTTSLIESSNDDAGVATTSERDNAPQGRASWGASSEDRTVATSAVTVLTRRSDVTSPRLLSASFAKS